MAILVAHVDNMPTTASLPVAMSGAKESLWKYFGIVDLGPVKWLLSIGIKQNRTEHITTLLQTAYIDSVSTHFHLEVAFRVKTLMDTNIHLTKKLTPRNNVECKCMNKLPYLMLVGSLMYTSMGTHPDITHTVRNLGEYSSNPRKAHWMAAQWVL